MSCIALLQNGRVPYIFPISVLDQLFDESTVVTSLCIRHLQRGLQAFGFQDVFYRFPILRHLFQANYSITPTQLIQILEPQFSPDGSTASTREKEMYGLLVRYIREVASGRRANLTLGNILSFVTGSSKEPVFGFEKKPSIKFLVSREYTVEINEQLATAGDDQVKLIMRVNGK